MHRQAEHGEQHQGAEAQAKPQQQLIALPERVKERLEKPERDPKKQPDGPAQDPEDRNQNQRNREDE